MSIHSVFIGDTLCARHCVSPWKQISEKKNDEIPCTEDTDNLIGNANIVTSNNMQMDKMSMHKNIQKMHTPIHLYNSHSQVPWFRPFRSTILWFTKVIDPVNAEHSLLFQVWRN